MSEPVKPEHWTHEQLTAVRKALDTRMRYDKHRRKCDTCQGKHDGQLPKVCVEANSLLREHQLAESEMYRACAR